MCVCLCVCIRVEYVCMSMSSVPFDSQLHSDFALLRIMEVADSFKESCFQRSL